MRPTQMIHDNLPLFPHVCMRCKAGPSEHRELFFDIGIDTDFDGVVYICDSCLNDICDQSQNHYFSKKAVDELLTEVSLLRAEALKTVVEHKLLIEALQELGLNTEKILENHGRTDSVSDGTVELLQVSESTSNRDGVQLSFTTPSLDFS